MPPTKGVFKGDAESDLKVAVQVKRMRQLHEQADDLRTTFRQWAGPRGTDARRID